MSSLQDARDLRVLGPAGKGKEDVLERQVVRARAQLVERSGGDDPSVAHDCDAVAKALGDFEDMSGQEDGGTAHGKLPQDILDTARAARVEANGRLVEKEGGRIVD